MPNLVALVAYNSWSVEMVGMKKFGVVGVPPPKIQGRPIETFPPWAWCVITLNFYAVLPCHPLLNRQTTMLPFGRHLPRTVGSKILSFRYRPSMDLTLKISSQSANNFLSCPAHKNEQTWVRFLTSHQHNEATLCHSRRYMLQNAWQKTNQRQTHYKNLRTTQKKKTT